jgi:hypothetical protein
MDITKRATIIANKVENDSSISAFQRVTLDYIARQLGLKDTIIKSTGEQPWRVESLAAKMLVERETFKKIGRFNNKDTYIRV